VSGLPQFYKVVKMCPDPQLLSVYLDEELPSPWKEKMEIHLTECSACREKLNSFRQLFEKSEEQEIIEAAKERVWQNLQSRRRFQPREGKINRAGIWQKRFSIPVPAAAAAAIVIMLMAALWFRGEPMGVQPNIGIAQQQADLPESGFFITPEDVIPTIMPATDIESVLQFLASEGDVIILSLPENRNFSRTSEPAIVRAADYQGNRLHWDEVPQDEALRRVIE
jgi:hypothetical protein